LDFRRQGEIALQQDGHDDSTDVRISDANPELAEDDFEGDDDDGGDDMDDGADDLQ